MIASMRLSFLLVPAFDWDAIEAQSMTSLDELGAVGNYETRCLHSDKIFDGITEMRTQPTINLPLQAKDNLVGGFGSLLIVA